jgi:4-amino-4-deoxy-L-arabinose transferase-like glycosyltransferase
MATLPSISVPALQQRAQPPRRRLLIHLSILLALWAAIFLTALSTPPLLDDADATHAQAAQAMLSTGDLVTLHVNGVRYLEKPPLPYWLAALSLRLFTTPATLDDRAAFAIHLPLALTVLGLALLGYFWSRRAFGPLTAFYAGLFTLTSTGVFLFTRVFIPDALLSLLLAFALYAFLRALESRPLQSSTPGKNQIPRSSSPGDNQVPRGFSLGSHSSATRWGFSPEVCFYIAAPYLMWLALALAVLTKGLVALVFFFGTAVLYLGLTHQLSALHKLKPLTGLLLFLAVAAPWHILAGLRNTGGAEGHGFFWFYFVNEHLLRFLGRRIPRDYNKLPTALYWSLHLVWLFPWSLFLPAAILAALQRRRAHLHSLDHHPTGEPLSRLELIQRRAAPVLTRATTFTSATTLLLAIFSLLVLVFFALSTNQEYYTFPVYLPLLILLAAALTPTPAHPAYVATNQADEGTNQIPQSLSAATNQVPRGFSLGSHSQQKNEMGALAPGALTFTYALFTLLGLAIAATLAYALYTSRHLPFVPDIGVVLAHRNVGDYTLSMSHFFDLTGPSFAALRLPAALAAIAFAIGPIVAWTLHARRRSQAAILTVALTSATFLIAAHIALARFTPLLSSRTFAITIQTLQRDHRISPDTQILLYGDQAFGSSIPFYLHHNVFLVDGRSTSMLFGSTFPDVPPVFVTPQQLATQWGSGPRKILFVPQELTSAQRSTVTHIVGSHPILLQESSDKTLLTDRPLDLP